MGEPLDPPTSPRPDVEQLRALPPDAWARVSEAARRALNELEAHQLPPRLQQLRALPRARLAQGRAREDLAQALAGGDQLWRLTAEAMGEMGDDPEELLARAGDATQPDAVATGGGSERLARRVAELEATVDQLRARHGDFVAERDEARRRAEGLEARLSTERDRLGELRERLGSAERERDELRQRLAAAAEEREKALERLRRQNAAETAALEEELRSLRRREEERVQELRAEQRLRAQAQRRAEQEVQDQRGSRSPWSATGARLGRPSKLPPGVGPGTTEAAARLVTEGQHVVVDGYNVTIQHKGHLSLEQQRIWLVRTLEGLAARTGASMTVVFDTREQLPAAPRPGRAVTSVFSHGRSADDEIVALVAAAPTERPILVVTDDRELTDRVREHAVDAIGTRAFLGLAR